MLRGILGGIFVPLHPTQLEPGANRKDPAANSGISWCAILGLNQ